MPVAVRVLLFGLFWFGILWMALIVICGGIASSASKSTPAPTGATVQHGPDSAERVGHAAGADFNERYGPWIMTGAAVLAAAGTLTGILPGTRRK
jgi:hypothetical protein